MSIGHNLTKTLLPVLKFDKNALKMTKKTALNQYQQTMAREITEQRPTVDPR